MNKNPFGISVGMNTYRLLPEYARAGFEVVEICLPFKPFEERRAVALAAFDAVKAAGHIGIGADRAVNYHSDHVGTALNYDVVSATVSNMRQGKGVAANWKQRIVDDFKGRKGRK